MSRDRLAYNPNESSESVGKQKNNNNNSNSDGSLTSRPTDGGKNPYLEITFKKKA